MTLLSLKQSIVLTRQISSIGGDYGVTLKLCSSPHSNGSIGSTVERIAKVPPAEAEEQYYARMDELAMAG
jgi:hypothetical protein